MINYVSRLILIVVVAFATAPAFADLDKGLDAYNKGDYKTALREWLPLAKKGNPDAQFVLGVMYYNGQGVPQDYKTAVKWYKLSAEQRVASAQSNLGLMYGNGQGVPKDYVRAHMWFNLAASNGVKKSQENRDEIASFMTSAQIEKAQALAQECIAKDYKGC